KGMAYNTYEGLVYKFNRKFVARDIQTLSSRIRQKVEPFLKLGPCPLCKGARLNQAALSCKVKGDTIADMAAMEVDELLEVVKGITEPAAAPIVRTLTERLQHLVEIGLEYLSLDRPTDTLSGGESQRVKMVKHLNGSLVDVMYIFDEPRSWEYHLTQERKELPLSPINGSSSCAILLLIRNLGVGSKPKALLLTRNSDDSDPGTDTHGLRCLARPAAAGGKNAYRLPA